MEFRKITYRMYPCTIQQGKLLELLGLHQRVYNTALEERINRYREQRAFGIDPAADPATAPVPFLEPKLLRFNLRRRAAGHH